MKAHKSALKHQDCVTCHFVQLSEAAARMSRRDWATMVLGVLFRMANGRGAR